jgi:hypothetical protein
MQVRTGGQALARLCQANGGPHGYGVMVLEEDLGPGMGGAEVNKKESGTRPDMA